MKITQLLPFLVCIATAHAATLTVSSTADDGTAGTLRTTLAAAATGDTVSITATGTITLLTGEIVVTGKNVAICDPPFPLTVSWRPPER